jgi:integrase/recombinase XerD
VKLAEALDELTRALCRQNLARATIEQYQRFIGVFIARMVGCGIEDVRQVQREHVESYQAELLARKLKPRTVASHIQAVRSLFRYLTDSGQLLCDPTERVVALRWQRSLPRRVVSETEMKKLLAAVNVSTRHGIRDRALLELLYGTAMRISEALSLEVSDVDLELCQVRIRKAKGRKERVVPSGKVARQWLEEYQSGVRPCWMKGRSYERRLFVTHHGKPLQKHTVAAVLRKLCNRAKLESIYPHAIRHAAATHMLRRGADIRMVQKLLGHEHLSTTQRYTQVAPVEVHRTHQRTHPLENDE